MSRRESMIAASDVLRRCAEHWSVNRRVECDAVAPDSYLAPLSDVAESLFALAVSTGPVEFRFCRWGDRLMRETGHDLTGYALGDPALGRFGRLQKAEYTDAMLEGAPITSRGSFSGANGVRGLNYARAAFPVYGREMTCRMIFGVFDFGSEAGARASAKIDLDTVLMQDVAQGEILDIELV